MDVYSFIHNAASQCALSLVARLGNLCHHLPEQAGLVTLSTNGHFFRGRPVIVGTGVDLCEVDRIRKAILSPHGRRLVERVFTPREIAYAERRANPYERYAARFAAKEAGMKALGTGWRGGLGWQDVEVVNLPSGRPTLEFHRRAAEIAEKLGAVNVALSITHTAEQALAMVILEGR